jgi:hypothetical protein
MKSIVEKTKQQLNDLIERVPVKKESSDIFSSF